MRLLIDIMSPTDFSGIVYSKPADLDVRYVVTNSVGYYILKKDGLETISKYYPAPFFNIEEVIKVSKDFFDGTFCGFVSVCPLHNASIYRKC
jgi:hypothetical protein